MTDIRIVYQSYDKKKQICLAPDKAYHPVSFDGNNWNVHLKGKGK